MCRWRFFWKDPLLSWNPQEWGVKQLTLNPKQIWQPDIMIFEQISVEETEVPISVYPNGDVYYSSPRLIEVGCNMNLTACECPALANIPVSD
jgi:hypothetical protein